MQLQHKYACLVCICTPISVVMTYCKLVTYDVNNNNSNN